MAGAGAGTGAEKVNGSAEAARHTTEVLHQRRKLPYCPFKMALGGFAFTAVVGYFVLYSKKKPEASAIDVAKVVSGISTPEHTHPRSS